MTAEIVNLRRVRKRAERRRDEKVADENRVLHGLAKGDREAARRETETRDRMLDQRRRDKPAPETSDPE